MPWTRAAGTVEAKLAHTEEWIERADPDLYGRNGEDGVIREHRERWAWMKGALGVLIALGGLNLLAQLLRDFGILK